MQSSKNPQKRLKNSNKGFSLTQKLLSNAVFVNINIHDFLTPQTVTICQTQFTFFIPCHKCKYCTVYRNTIEPLTCHKEFQNSAPVKLNSDASAQTSIAATAMYERFRLTPFPIANRIAVGNKVRLSATMLQEVLYDNSHLPLSLQR